MYHRVAESTLITSLFLPADLRAGISPSRHQGWRNRCPAAIRLRRIIARQVVKNAIFRGRIELPQILCCLHPANHIEPGLPISTLLRYQSMRMTTAAMCTYVLPPRRLDQASRRVRIGGERGGRRGDLPGVLHAGS